jgi:hypothetical protein
MSRTILCPCGKRVQVYADAGPVRIRCPHCRRTLQVGETGGAAARQTLHQAPASLSPASKAKEAPGQGLHQTPASLSRAEKAKAAAPQFWKLSHSITDNLVVLTSRALFAAKLADEVLPAAMAALEKGRPPEEVLAGQTVVPLDDLTAVEMNRAVAMLTVRYLRDGRIRATTFFCPNRQTRDEMYEGLQRRLGRGWTEHERQVSRWTSSSLSLICLAVLLVLSAIYFPTAWNLEQAAAAGEVDRSSLVKGVVGWVFDRCGLVFPGIVAGLGLLGCLVWLVCDLVAPPLLVNLQRDEQPILPRKGFWSRYAYVTAAFAVIILLSWILAWCGVVIPRWVNWTIGGIMLILYVWILWTDEPASVGADKESKSARGEDAPAPPPPPPPAPQGPTPAILPEGVVFAPANWRCARCTASGLMALPANAFSRQPGFFCPKCGAYMRPAGSAIAYGAISVVGGFVTLLAAGLALVAQQQSTYAEERLHGAVMLGFFGVLGAGWAIKQLRLPTPKGAQAQPISLRPWIIALVIVGSALLVLGGGLFFLLYAVHEM